MWCEAETDMLIHSFVCVKHKDRKNEIDPSTKSKIIKLMNESFRFMRIKTLSFIFENDDSIYYSKLFRKWIEENNLFHLESSPLYDKKELKEQILFIDSVITLSLCLFSEVCYFCTKIVDLSSFITHRNMMTLPIFLREDISYQNCLREACLHPNYKIVTSRFNHSKELMDFAFLISYYTFSTTFGEDPKQFQLDTIDTEEYQALKLTGNEAYKKEKYESALCVYSTILQKYPYAYQILGNKAQVFLKLEQFSSAELISHLSLAINPKWCKGFYKLAKALFHQNILHKAHFIASSGVKQCNDVQCVDHESLQEFVVTLTQQCKKCNSSDTETTIHELTQENVSLLPNSDNKALDATNCDNVSAESDNMDIPDLTDSSSVTTSGSETPTEDPNDLLLLDEIECEEDEFERDISAKKNEAYLSSPNASTNVEDDELLSNVLAEDNYFHLTPFVTKFLEKMSTIATTATEIKASDIVQFYNTYSPQENETPDSILESSQRLEEGLRISKLMNLISKRIPGESTPLSQKSIEKYTEENVPRIEKTLFYGLLTSIAETKAIEKPLLSKNKLQANSNGECTETSNDENKVTSLKTSCIKVLKSEKAEKPSTYAKVKETPSDPKSTKFYLETKAVETSDEIAVETSDEKVVETSDEKIVETSDEKIVETSDEKVVETSDEKAFETQKKKTVKTPSDKKAIETTDKKTIETPDEKTVGTPDKKGVKVANRKVSKTPSGEETPQTNDVKKPTHSQRNTEKHLLSFKKGPFEKCRVCSKLFVEEYPRLKRSNKSSKVNESICQECIFLSLHKLSVQFSQSIKISGQPQNVKEFVGTLCGISKNVAKIMSDKASSKPTTNCKVQQHETNIIPSNVSQDQPFKELIKEIIRIILQQCPSASSLSSMREQFEATIKAWMSNLDYLIGPDKLSVDEFVKIKNELDIIVQNIKTREKLQLQQKDKADQEKSCYTEVESNVQDAENKDPVKKPLETSEGHGVCLQDINEIIEVVSAYISKHKENSEKQNAVNKELDSMASSNDEQTYPFVSKSVAILDEHGDDKISVEVQELFKANERQRERKVLEALQCYYPTWKLKDLKKYKDSIETIKENLHTWETEVRSNQDEKVLELSEKELSTTNDAFAVLRILLETSNEQIGDVGKKLDNYIKNRPKSRISFQYEEHINTSIEKGIEEKVVVDLELYKFRDEFAKLRTNYIFKIQKLIDKLNLIKNIKRNEPIWPTILQSLINYFINVIKYLTVILKVDENEEHFAFYTFTNFGNVKKEICPIEEKLRMLVQKEKDKKLNKDTIVQCLDLKTLAKFENALNEGSSAIKMEIWSIAMLHFGQASEMVKNVPELCVRKKIGEIAVRFVYGYVSYHCSTYESTNGAISAFKEVIEISARNIAPAYYFLGLSYSKFHKFKDALKCFETVASLDEKDYKFNTYDFLDEKACKMISYEKIRGDLKDEIYKCKYPRPPEAQCRYKECPQDPSIYINDLTFKSFMCLHCQERCALQYHMACWKFLKETLNKTDKEFLDNPCFTPDCNGLIIKVEVIGKCGAVEKDFISENNYKPKKITKQKKSKLEKKQFQKERKKLHVRIRSISETSELHNDEPVPVFKIPSEPDHSPEIQRKSTIKEFQPIAEATAKQISGLGVNAKHMYVTKKHSDEKDCDKPIVKYKEKKKQKKSTLSLDEFCEGYSEKNIKNCNDYQLRLHRLQETKRVVEEKAYTNNKFPTLQSTFPSSNLLSASYQLDDFNENIDVQEDEDPSNSSQSDLSKTIQLYFENLLDIYGFLPLNDPLLQNAIDKLSNEARAFIDEKGGFVNYIQCNSEFAVVNETFCRFSDMLNVYRRDSFSRGYSTHDSFDNLDMNDSSLSDVSHPKDSEFNNYTDISVFSERNEMDLLDDTNDSSSHLFNNNVIENDSIEDQLDDEKGCIIITQANQFTEGYSLNPHAMEYNPSKENNSEGSSSSQETKSDQPVSSLFHRLASMRQDLSSYNVGNFHSVASHSFNDVSIKSKEPVQIKSEENLDQNSEPISFVDYCHRHFRDLSKSENTADILNSYQTLKSLIQQLEKMCNLNKDISIQVGTPAVQMVSQGVMKNDEQLKQIIAYSNSVQHENNSIIDDKKRLEEKLCEALDKQTEIQNRYQVDISSLKKDLEDNQDSYVTEIKNLKRKQSALEKDVKSWRQKYDEITDKEKESGTSNQILKTKLETCTKKLLKLEEENGCIKKEIQCRDNDHKQVINEFEKQLKFDEESIKNLNNNLTEANLKLKNSELEILKLKKTEYLKAYDVHIASVNATREDSKHALKKMENMSPGLLETFKMLEVKLLTHLNDVCETRLQFIEKITLQELEVENGSHLSRLEKIDIPNFPSIPTIETALQSINTNTSLFSNNQFGTGQTNSRNVLLNSEPFQQKSTQNFVNQTNQSLGLSYLNSNSSNNFSLFGQSSGFSQNSNHPMLSNAFYPQSNVYQNFAPTIPNNPYSFPSLLQNKEKGSSPDIFNSQALNTAGNSKSSHVDNNPTKYFPPGLPSRQSSYSDSSETKEIPKSNVIGLNQHTPWPANTPSSMSSLDNVELPCENIQNSAISESHSIIGSDHSSARSKPVCAKGSTLSLASGMESNSTKLIDDVLELDYSGPVQASKTAVTKSQTSTGADAKTSKDSTKSLLVRVIENLEFRPKKRYSRWTVQGFVKMNKGIVKVLNLLKIEFPDKKEAELMSAIKMYREKKGRLSNIPISTVVDDVKNIVNYTKMKPIKVPELNYPEMIRNRSVVNKPLTSSSMPVMPPPTPKTGPTMAPWANKSSNSERQALNWTAPVKENQCSVCIEKLTEKSAYRVDCGHLFHLPCIKMWLKKQSNCPVCRQHLLLPDEYPSLS